MRADDRHQARAPLSAGPSGCCRSRWRSRRGVERRRGRGSTRRSGRRACRWPTATGSAVLAQRLLRTPARPGDDDRWGYDDRAPHHLVSEARPVVLGVDLGGCDDRSERRQARQRALEATVFDVRDPPVDAVLRGLYRSGAAPSADPHLSGPGGTRAPSRGRTRRRQAARRPDRRESTWRSSRPVRR